MGHSFGCVLSALMLAMAPGQFQRAMLLDPVLFPPGMMKVVALSDVLGLFRHNALARKARNRQAAWTDRTAAHAPLRGRGGFEGWTAEALQAYVDFGLKPGAQGGVELTCSTAREADIYATHPRRLWSMLSTVQTPVRMEHGERTFPFVVRSARHWQRVNAAVKVERVPGGHCCMQQDPERSAQRIKAFLLGG